MAVHLAPAHTPVKKGVTAMPNVVEEYQIGGSTIQIADDFVRTDPEEIERILDSYKLPEEREAMLADKRINTVCHSFVTDGRIQFLADCTHALAGQTVDLPEWPK